MAMRNARSALSRSINNAVTILGSLVFSVALAMSLPCEVVWTKTVAVRGGPVWFSVRYAPSSPLTTALSTWSPLDSDHRQTLGSASRRELPGVAVNDLEGHRNPAV